MRILRRAVEIEGQEDAGPVTVDQLRVLAGEAGLGPRAVERAIGDALQSAGASRYPVRKHGVLITKLSAIRTLPYELDSEQLLRTVRMFQPYREGPAQVKLGEHEITWRDRKGLRFTMASAGGTTEIRVKVSKPLVRKGRWMGWVKAACDRLEALVVVVGEDHSASVD